VVVFWLIVILIPAKDTATVQIFGRQRFPF